MDLRDGRDGRVWACWLILIVLFTSYATYAAVESVLNPAEPVGSLGDLALLGVGAAISVAGFANLALGSYRFPEPELRGLTVAIVWGCTFAWVASLAVAVSYRI